MQKNSHDYNRLWLSHYVFYMGDSSLNICSYNGSFVSYFLLVANVNEFIFDWQKVTKIRPCLGEIFIPRNSKFENFHYDFKTVKKKAKLILTLQPTLIFLFFILSTLK